MAFQRNQIFELKQKQEPRGLLHIYINYRNIQNNFNRITRSGKIYNSLSPTAAFSTGSLCQGSLGISRYFDRSARKVVGPPQVVPPGPSGSATSQQESYCCPSRKSSNLDAQLR